MGYPIAPISRNWNSKYDDRCPTEAQLARVAELGGEYAMSRFGNMWVYAETAVHIVDRGGHVTFSTPRPTN